MAEERLQLVIDAEDRTGGAFGKVSGGLESMKSKVEAMQPTFAKMAAVGTASMLAIGAVVGKGIKDYVEAERSQRQLEHAIIGVSKGTKEQVSAVNEITAALQKKAGVDADALNMGVAQLSTFGLQSKSVVDLTKSLADYTVNQAGVTAGADQYVQSANTIAKALNGQFGILEKSGIRFTEAQQHMILYGTEAQKVSALQEGLNQNLRETTDTIAGSAEANMAKFSQSIGEISESIGKTFLPILQQILDKVQPIVEKILEWTQAHPELARNLIIGAAAVAGLVTVIGGLGLILPTIITGVTMLGTAITFVAANPIVLLIAALVLMIAWVTKAAQACGGFKEFFRQTWDGIVIILNEAVDKIIAKIQPLIDAFNKVKNAISGAVSSARDFGSSVGGKAKGLLGFDTGGVVPGAVGAPRLAVVHGGETILPTHKKGFSLGGGSGITLVLQGNTFMGKEGVAEQIGNIIIKQLQLRGKVTN